METCDYELCKNLPEFICECEGKTAKFCEKHIEVHGLNKCQHNITPNSIPITKAQKKIFHVSCSQGIEKLKLMEEKVIKQSRESIQRITSIAIKDLEFLRERQSIFNDVIEYIMNNDEIIKMKEPNKRDQIIFKLLGKEPVFDELQKIEDEMMELLDFENTIKKMQEKEENNTKNNEKKFDIIYKCLGISSYVDLINNYDYEYEKSNFIFYPENDTKNLICVNPFNAKDSKHVLDISDNLRYYGGICLISKNELLYNLQNKTFIIDLERKVGIKKRSSSQNRDYTGQVCEINKTVYFFDSQISEKYHILTNTWKTISQMPTSSKYNSCTGIISDIILTGRELDCVYKYNINLDSYIKYGNFTSGKNKVLLREFFKIYILEEGKIYENINPGFTEFRVVSTGVCIPNKYMRGYPIKKDNYIYFVLSDKYIYQFDLKLKALKQVRKIVF